jgi:hypothetical protein
MIEHEADYCPDCNAIWPKGQETCTGCGFVAMNEGDMHSGPDGYSPTPPTRKPNTAAVLMRKRSGTTRFPTSSHTALLASPSAYRRR